MTLNRTFFMTLTSTLRTLTSSECKEEPRHTGLAFQMENGRVRTPLMT